MQIVKAEFWLVAEENVEHFSSVLAKSRAGKAGDVVPCTPEELKAWREAVWLYDEKALQANIAASSPQ